MKYQIIKQTCTCKIICQKFTAYINWHNWLHLHRLIVHFKCLRFLLLRDNTLSDCLETWFFIISLPFLRNETDCARSLKSWFFSARSAFLSASIKQLLASSLSNISLLVACTNSSSVWVAFKFLLSLFTFAPVCPLNGCCMYFAFAYLQYLRSSSGTTNWWFYPMSSDFKESYISFVAQSVSHFILTVMDWNFS